MSVSPELMDVRDMNKMMAEATLRKVKSLISVPELYRREQATETLMKIFQVVNGYVVDMTAETQKVCDEAMKESLAELNMQQQQQQQQQQQTQLPIAASPAIEHAAATAAAAAAAAAADDSQL